MIGTGVVARSKFEVTREYHHCIDWGLLGYWQFRLSLVSANGAHSLAILQ